MNLYFFIENVMYFIIALNHSLIFNFKFYFILNVLRSKIFYCSKYKLSLIVFINSNLFELIINLLHNFFIQLDDLISLVISPTKKKLL